MASSLQRKILIGLLLSIVIPISIGHNEDSDDESLWENDSEPKTDNRDDSDAESDDHSEIGLYLRDLCSDITTSKQCWRIIKPVKDRSISRYVAGVVIDMAIEKSNEIHGKLNQLHRDSGDDALKEKYRMCASNYYDVNQDLEMTKNNLDSDEYRRIHVLVDDAANELKSCKYQLGKTSTYPEPVRDMNKEFGRYVDIIKAAMRRFVKEKGDDSTEKTN